MASSVPPAKGSAYTEYISLVSQADTDIFQKSVTLAAGDVKVSKDGGDEANIGTLPTENGTTGILAVALTAAEMTADTVTVRFCDAAGDEWCDALLTIHTAAQTLDTIDTNVDAVLVDTGTTLDGKINTIDTNVDAILADTGTDGVVIADGAITAAKIATDAITAAKIAADAIGASELAADAALEIADAILSRGVSNVEATADRASLAELILAAFESAISSATWTIYRTDHATTFGTRTVTTSSSADPITEVT